jgi:hypothetical protein
MNSGPFMVDLWPHSQPHLRESDLLLKISHYTDCATGRSHASTVWPKKKSRLWVQIQILKLLLTIKLTQGSSRHIWWVRSFQLYLPGHLLSRHFGIFPTYLPRDWFLPSELVVPLMAQCHWSTTVHSYGPSGELEGTMLSFILHYQEQIRLYDQLQPPHKQTSDHAKMIYLHNAGYVIKELRLVQTTGSQPTLTLTVSVQKKKPPQSNWQPYLWSISFAHIALSCGDTGPALESGQANQEFVIAFVCRFQVILSHGYINFLMIDDLRQRLLNQYLRAIPRFRRNRDGLCEKSTQTCQATQTWIFYFRQLIRQSELSEGVEHTDWSYLPW